MRLKDIDFAEHIATERTENPLYADALKTFQDARTGYFKAQQRLMQVVKLVDNEELNRRRRWANDSQDLNSEIGHLPGGTGEKLWRYR